MNGFEKLLKCAGEWSGRNGVQPSVGDPVEESSSRLTITPILNGTFLRLDQDWAYKTEPQFGSMLIGYSPKQERVSVYWIDTWHNGRGAMILAGRFDSGGKLIVHGDFAVDSGPDWGWRIEMQIDGEEKLSINMFCVNSASGRDEGWVRSSFQRKK